jgi:ribonuclease D
MHIEAGLHPLSVPISLATGDIPFAFLQQAQRAGKVAVDIETDGLDFRANNIGAVQLFNGETVCVVRPPFYRPENLFALIASIQVKKVFHHAMFDLRFLKYQMGIEVQNVACTKIASKIVHPELKDHSLAGLLKMYKGIELDKSLRRSDWLESTLSHAQILYAMKDVYYLVGLLDDIMRDARARHVHELVNHSFSYIPSRVDLDIIGAGDVFVY